MALNNIEITEQLFEAIDAIVRERIRTLPYDKTLVATITNIDDAPYGKYEVTTDTNIKITAYSEETAYQLGEWVYVKVPQNDYSKHKIITERYVPENPSEPLDNYIDIDQEIELLKQYGQLQYQIDEINDMFSHLSEIKEKDTLMKYMQSSNIDYSILKVEQQLDWSVITEIIKKYKELNPDNALVQTQYEAIQEYQNIMNSLSNMQEQLIEYYDDLLNRLQIEQLKILAKMKIKPSDSRLKEAWEQIPKYEKKE